jgi:hypothetical protein
MGVRGIEARRVSQIQYSGHVQVSISELAYSGTPHGVLLSYCDHKERLALCKKGSDVE